MCTIRGRFKNLYHYTAAVFPPPYAKYGTADYVIVTMDETAEIEIVFNCRVDSVCIRPLSANVKYKHSGNRVTVFLDRPLNFSVEINNSVENNVMIFADYEKSYMLKNYDDVIFFPEGEHFPDLIEIKNDNTAVYLEKGAYVHGCIKAENVKNIAVFGQGVLTLESYVRHLEKRDTGRDNLLFINNCRNVKISDTVITDGCNWSCKIFGCDNVEIDNLKIIGCRGNTDGIDICGSRDVYVHNCFTRVWDDSLVVKSRDCGNVDNVLFEKCALWCDMAHPIEVGVELRADYIKNVVFRDIDIIHSMCGYSVLGIHHGDRARVSNITFEDIRIEDAPSCQLFDIRISDSVWNKDNAKGPVSNILFKDIQYIGKQGCDRLLSNSRIEGYSEEAFVDGVTIENVTVKEKSAFTDLNCGLDIYDYVKNVKLIPSKMQDKAGVIKTEIRLEDKTEYLDNGMCSTDVTVSFYNTDVVSHRVSACLEVYPKSSHYEDRFPIEINIKPKEKCEIKKKIILPAGKYALGITSDDMAIMPSYEFLKLDLLLTENFMDSMEYFFDTDSETQGVSFALKKDLLMIKTELLKSHKMILHTALSTDKREGEVLFSVRETDMGMAPAMVFKGNKAIPAPQLRNYEEITYVFKNQPRIKEYRATEIAFSKTGIACISLDKIGIGTDDKCFLMELELPEFSNARYSCSLFNSQNPTASSHMFVCVKRKGTNE